MKFVMTFGDFSRNPLLHQGFLNGFFWRFISRYSFSLRNSFQDSIKDFDWDSFKNCSRILSWISPEIHSAISVRTPPVLFQESIDFFWRSFWNSSQDFFRDTSHDFSRIPSRKRFGIFWQLPFVIPSDSLPSISHNILPKSYISDGVFRKTFYFL